MTRSSCPGAPALSGDCAAARLAPAGRVEPHEPARRLVRFLLDHYELIKRRVSFRVGSRELAGT